MHCFEGHSVFRINDSNGQPSLSKLMNSFEANRLSLNLKDDSNILSKLAMNTLITQPAANINMDSATLTAAINSNNKLASGNNYFCSRHKNELLKFYCRTCSVPVCKDCIVAEHQAGLHDCEHISDATVKQIENLLQIVAEVRGKASDMRAIIKNAENNAVRIQGQYNKAQNEIADTYQFYRSMLDERKAELLKELENFYNTKNMAQSVLITKSQDHVDKVLQSCDFVERITKHGGLTETIVLRKLMENKLQSFLSYIQELQASCEIDFVSNYQAIQVGVRNTFGYIRSTPEMPTKQPPIARPTSNILTNGNSPSNSTVNLNNQNQQQQPQQHSSSPQFHSRIHSGLHPGSIPSIAYHRKNADSETTQQQQHNGTNGIIERPFSNGTSSMLTAQQQSDEQQSLISFDSNIISKRFNGANSLGPFIHSFGENNLQENPYEKWSNGGSDNIINIIADQYTIPLSSCSVNGNGNSQTDAMTFDLTSKLMSTPMFPPKSQIKRQKMIYHCKFGEFGVTEGQFTEPSGVAVNAQNDIIVADTNNHRIQIFDKEGRFKFQFGECGKRDGQLLYPNRVAVVRTSGDIIVTERSPTHQIQIYNQYGQFVRKFGANILQHPRGVTVDNKGRIVVVECKVMRVIIFDQTGNVLQKFGCSKHLEFPNGVVVNDKQEIFISDNRAHCVKVFSYEGVFLRQIGGEGITNYPIGVGINAAGEILIADNHNNFNLTIFTQDGQLVSALESKVKHAQCFDVALMDDGSVVLASKDYRLYIYRYVLVPPN